MRRVFIRLSPFWILLGIGITQSLYASSEPVDLRGQVVTESGEVLAGAQVLIGGWGAVSVADGTYLLPVEKGAQYSIKISKQGFYSSYHTFSHADLLNNSSASLTLNVTPITLVEKKSGRTLLVFAGDTMMARRYLQPPPGEPRLIADSNQLVDMKNILRHVKPYLELADIASVNLETQLLDGVSPQALPKSVTFYTHPDILPALQWAGVDYVALGNNHTFDYMDRGLSETLDALAHYQMPFSGAGVNEVMARQAASVPRYPGIDFFSYVGWSGSFIPNQVAGKDKGGAAFGKFAAIEQDLNKVSGSRFSVLQYHSGIEYQSTPALSEVTLLKGAIDAGADLAIGHHAHVLQGLDYYKNRLIAYSLGNFVFDQYIYSTQLGMLLYVWMDEEKFHRAEIVPLYLNGYIPTPATGQIRYDILQRLLHLSNLASLDFSETGSHAAVLPNNSTGKAVKLDATHFVGSALVHLMKLGVSPLTRIQTVNLSSGSFRLGVDLVKRGNFESHGDYGIINRNWIKSNRLTIDRQNNNHLVVSGTARVGQQTFERAFGRSVPASISVKLSSSGPATLAFSLQRRKMNQSRSEALVEGPMEKIGEVIIEAVVDRQIVLDFVMPRAQSKGIRLLIDVKQTSGDIVKIDDLALIEWQTPWLDSGSPVLDSQAVQATHLQISHPQQP